jgi:poly(hydroxyalkanoate) depolymerase family esterase
MNLKTLLAALAIVLAAASAHAAEFEPLPGPHAGGSKVWWWNMQVKAHVPAAARGKPGPVVMLLHGCGQEGVPFAIASGWRDLSERRGFALVVVEFKDFVAPFGTEGKNCLWWFDEEQRSPSELSIPGKLRQAVLSAREAYSIAGGDNFVVGLSAGAGMAMVMLTTYPDDFAAGASVAGVAVGCSSIGANKGGYMTMTPELRRAFGCMEGPAGVAAADWGREAARINPNRFKWPRLSIWQGDSDPVVKCVNAVQIAQQWAGLHHSPMPGFTACEAAPLPPSPFAPVWTAGEAVELRILPGLDHSVPVVPKAGCGSDGDHVKSFGVCAAAEIAGFFGIK